MAEGGNAFVRGAKEVGRQISGTLALGAVLALCFGVGELSTEFLVNQFTDSTVPILGVNVPLSRLIGLVVGLGALGAGARAYGGFRKQDGYWDGRQSMRDR
jgi:hypothetical protein